MAAGARSRLEKLSKAIAAEFARGDLPSALKSSRLLLTEFPKHPFGWKAMGAILVQSGRHSEARIPLQKAIRLSPGDADNWANLGNLERGLGDTQEAIKCYQKAIRIRPDHTTAKVNLATILSETGSTHAAIDVLNSLLAVTPGLPAAHLALGNIHKGGGDFGNAEKSYLAALTIQPDYFEAMLNLSSVYREQGHLARALEVCTNAAKLRPGSAMAHSNLGNILAAMRQSLHAIDAYRRAISLQPDFVEASINLANVLRQTGDLEESVRLCRMVIATGIRLPQAQLNLAFSLFEKGEMEEAASELAELLRHDCRNSSAHILSGLLAVEEGRLDDALELADRAIQLAGTDPYVQLGAGSILAAAGKTFEAEIHFRRAIQLDPYRSEALLNLSNLLFARGRHTDALEIVSKALEVDSALAHAYATKALILRDLRDLEGAQAHAAIALELRPDVPQIQSAMGLIELDLGRVVDAHDHLRNALAAGKDQCIPLLNYANALREMGRHHESIAVYRRAFEVSRVPRRPGGRASAAGHTDAPRPTDVVPQASSNYLLALNYHSTEPDAEIFRAATLHAASFGAPRAHREIVKPAGSEDRRDRPGALRVGFVSGDLREHPVGYFTEELFEHLATSGYALFAYPSTPVEDSLTQRVKGRFMVWRPIHGVSDDEASSLIRDDQLDVLIDLSGHTANNRLGVFARRSARLQATWLGYCGTTGLSEMDYIIADDVVIEAAEEAWYSERVARIEGSYACLSALPHVPCGANPPMLDQGYCTFGSFNNLAKIDNNVIATWAVILRELPGSKLFLKSKQFADRRARLMVSDLLAAHGIQHERLIFEAAEKRHAYLSAYNRVDLALDPFPYPGFTTTLEALWMGVPVITMRGKRFIQRNGEMVMKNLAMRDWIASDNLDYIAKAISFATEPAALAALRASLRERLARSSLMDIAGFTRKFGTLLESLRSGG